MIKTEAQHGLIMLDSQQKVVRNTYTIIVVKS
jgi:hypothetical protein